MKGCALYYKLHKKLYLYMEMTFKSIYLFSVWCLLYLKFVKHRGASLNIHWALLHKGQTGGQKEAITWLGWVRRLIFVTSHSWKKPFWQTIQRKLNKVLRIMQPHVYLSCIEKLSPLASRALVKIDCIVMQSKICWNCCIMEHDVNGLTGQ